MMVDEFNDNIDTPTEADLEACYGSKYLSATDIGSRKIKAKIAKIRKEELKQNNGPTRNKFILYFDVVDKAMVLNATNKQVLVDALGTKPADWIGAEVGILAEPVQFAGKSVMGLRVRVLGKPAQPGKVSTPRPDKPAPKPAAAKEEPWPDEAGDPGFDDSPDFHQAAE
jgi:hypothetical protein